MSTQRDFKNAGSGANKPKPRKRAAPKKSAASGKPADRSAPGWLWLVAGLLIGLLVAGLVYLKQNPTDNKPVASSTNKPAAVKKPVKKAAPKPVDESPRFDFYDMLPEMEVEVPREAPATSSTKSDQPTARYVLQVGSFRTLKQADSLKAKLAFLGYQATIQTVTVNNNSTWHRVHLGPYTGRKELNKVRAKLWENKINTVPMRISN